MYAYGMVGRRMTEASSSSCTVVAIPYKQFNPANIRFTPVVKNKYFKGTFSQIKYEYGPFTIYNPILLIPANGSMEEWVRQIESALAHMYADQHVLIEKPFHSKTIPFTPNGLSDYIGIKISGIWATDTGYGLNYIWLKK